MLKISILSCRGVEVSSGGDEADRTSQAELECEIEGSATIGRVSQKLTPLAATSTKHAVHGLRSGVEPAPFNHNFAVFFLLCGLKYTSFSTEQPPPSVCVKFCPCICLFLNTFDRSLVQDEVPIIGGSRNRPEQGIELV